MLVPGFDWTPKNCMGWSPLHWEKVMDPCIYIRSRPSSNDSTVNILSVNKF